MSGVFYDPRTGRHGLPRNPFLALVAPRPIGWISSVSADGLRNLAPYSYFNCLSSDPAVIGFSSSGRKDSLRNVTETGCFVANIVSADLAAAMNETSVVAPADVDEFEVAGLTAVPGTSVAAPRVAEARAALECVHVETVEIRTRDGTSAGSFLVIGEVVGIHIDDAILTDGFVDVAKLQPLSRLGYMDYAVVRESFSMQRPPPRG